MIEMKLQQKHQAEKKVHINWIVNERMNQLPLHLHGMNAVKMKSS